MKTVSGFLKRHSRRWKIYFGVDPRRIPGPALVFFPCSPDMLSCGLAGILAIRQPEPQDNPASMHMESLFAAIKHEGISKITDGVLPAERYLDGAGALAAMETCISALKSNSACRRFYFVEREEEALKRQSGEMSAFLRQEQDLMQVCAGNFSTHEMELINSRLTRLKDICWTLEKDILDNIENIRALTGLQRRAELNPNAFCRYRMINFLLNCLGRLEVRGRDSAGIQISVSLRDSQDIEDAIEHLRQAGLYEEFQRRTTPGDTINGSIEYSSARKSFSFTYKTASIIGELGRNIQELQKSVTSDAVFRSLAAKETVFETTLAHTRWASVGAITEDNCHPVNNYMQGEKSRHYPAYGSGEATINVVLNGDIDNYETLRHGLENGRYLLAPEVTTDTKIIPLQIEKYLREGYDLTDSFRRAAGDFDGSHAIAMTSNLEPSKAFLALKGSGQTIYIGLASDRYVFASELYGIVNETSAFIKMDGEKLSVAGEPDSNGQIVILEQDSKGGLDGIKAIYYNGLPCHWQETDIRRAEITTRDIDRGAYPHFFLKEISESTLSVHKTLMGKYRIIKGANGGRQVRFNLGVDVIPEKIRLAFERNEIRRIILIGHGTAAVAGAAVADSLERYLAGANIKVEAKVASELSGFHMQDDLHDTLIIPITQSGATTDTNRAVAMAAQRGAAIIAVVNRRQSDITSKADGVFYTSDGRDIEMSVASTKAFYSQIIAGHVLSLYLAQMLKTLADDRIAKELENLEQAPALMQRVLDKKEEICTSVEEHTGRKKFWAVVGSGPLKAAADEIRIKLSELCYKTISSDVIENKKHIDLSAEPLIIVCAAGVPESVAGDIVKDTAIFKAHKATVIVFADEGETRFDAIADAIIKIPLSEMPLPVILNTVAGHLLGYYAACKIDKEAIFFREFRGRLNMAATDTGKHQTLLYERISDRQFRNLIRDFSTSLHERLAGGAFSLAGAHNMFELVLLLKYAAGKLPLEDYWQDFRDETISPIDRLDICLGHIIDELSRPIDSIRHQAKTVTVGTSRKEQTPSGIVFELFQELGIPLRQITGKNIPAIKKVQPAIAAVSGYTLYNVENLDAEGSPQDTSTIAIRQRGGIALEMRSRVERHRSLMGVKKTIVATGNIYLGRGQTDGASIMIVPLLGENARTRNLLLIHLRYNESLSAEEKISVLGHRFNDLRNLINEYNLPWDDCYLNSFTLEELFSDPLEIIASRIKASLEA